MKLYLATDETDNYHPTTLGVFKSVESVLNKVKETHPHIVQVGDNAYICCKLEDGCIFNEDNIPYMLTKGFQNGKRTCSNFYMEVLECEIDELLLGLD